MGSGVKTARLRIGGMTCVNCQNKIEKKLRCTAGILSAGVSCGSGNAYITYDADIISLRDIRTVIEKQGYKVIADAGRGPRGAGRVIGLLIIIAALYMLLRQFGILNLLVPGRLAQTNMGYGMLFVVGLLTSVHCIAMCGGINLSQCIVRTENAEQRGVKPRSGRPFCTTSGALSLIRRSVLSSAPWVLPSPFQTPCRASSS